MEKINMDREFMSEFRVNGSAVFSPKDNVFISAGMGRAFPVAPVASRLMLFLCCHPNLIVKRKDIFQAVWEDFGFEVSQGSINQTIFVLRSTLDDVGVGSRCIRTVPRIGYCLLAEVEKITSGVCSAL
ncbi:winged helix-turn-helix domain-containing protein [Pandoraea faecigallinarum]|uniref:winged helix-turn-helix domain-containing protein n=1 Tax=Pandoraea faecigallinarum TaxID=656179 RepID=UPI00064C3771|nr:winged helix-turn-helix domain-containing protein [Pandoraea faecigallinarum]